MRWKHPARGLLTASAFLPLIEDNFLFDELTTSCSRSRSCSAVAGRPTGWTCPCRSTSRPTCCVDGDSPDRIEAKVREHDLPANRLIIEVSEAAVARDIGDALENLVQLRVKGFGLAIDDYGTGHCSREQLERIPASEMKIDRKMLAGAARRPPLKALLADRPGDRARPQLQDRRRRRREPGGMGPGQRAGLRHGAGLLHRTPDGGRRPGQLAAGLDERSVPVTAGRGHEPDQIDDRGPDRSNGPILARATSRLRAAAWCALGRGSARRCGRPRRAGTTRRALRQRRG